MQRLLLLFSILLLLSCGNSRKTGADIPGRSDLRGSWQVTDIRFSGVSPGEKLSFTLLDEGTEDCIKGSTWYLPNNGKGSYTINSNGPGCQPGERSVVWSYRKEGDQAWFQYKRVEAGVKANDVEEGYRFRIVSLSDNQLVLESTVQYQGNLLTINYVLLKA